jgi:hypothetical protein
MNCFVRPFLYICNHLFFIKNKGKVIKNKTNCDAPLKSSAGKFKNSPAR